MESDNTPTLRRVRKTYYPVPPVCHLRWTEEDWRRAAVTVEEPDTLTGPSGTWDWTGEYNERDEKLYRRRADQPTTSKLTNEA